MHTETFISNHTQYRIKTIVKRNEGKPVLHTYLIHGAKVLLETITPPEARSRDILKWGRDAATLIYNNPNNKNSHQNFIHHVQDTKTNKRLTFKRSYRDSQVKRNDYEFQNNRSRH